MTIGISTLAWLVVSPIAVLTDILAVCILCHYRSQFHGTDVSLLSLTVSMAINAIVIVPVPAILKVTDTEWTPEVCEFYVWVFITSRLVQLFTLVLLVLHWVGILKISASKSDFSSTKIIKISVPILWFSSGVLGLLPVIGAFEDDYQNKGDCNFLAFNISRGFSIFFGIFIILCLFVCGICELDVIIILRKMKNIALLKYGAGRFYLPRKRSGVAGGYTVHERYSQLNFAWDLCRLTAGVVCFSFFVNHVPYAVIQFLQIFGNDDTDTLEYISIWLILVESLVLPHFFWSLSRRYRHALCYIWKVVILRRPRDDDEDPDLCTLQSFTRRIRDNPWTSGVIQTENNLGSPDGGTPRSGPYRNGLSANQVRGTQENDSHQASSITLNSSRTVDGRHNFDIVTVESTKFYDHNDSPRSISNKDPQFLDLKRTASGNSRKEWKEQMRKKHLPAIFINEAFDASDSKLQTSPVSAPVLVNNVDATDTTSLYYYMSSDYHPDYLNTDSLPRKQKNVIHKSQESFSSDSLVYQGKIGDSYTNFNSLPRNLKESTDSTSSNGLARKKPPKMGLKSKESSLGSSSSLYKTHSRGASLDSSLSYRIMCEQNKKQQLGGSPKNPRLLKQQLSFQGRQDSERSESEGASGQYEDVDIVNVLDNGSMISSELLSRNDKKTGYNIELDKENNCTDNDIDISASKNSNCDEFEVVPSSINSENFTEKPATFCSSHGDNVSSLKENQGCVHACKTDSDNSVENENSIKADNSSAFIKTHEKDECSNFYNSFSSFRCTDPFSSESVSQHFDERNQMSSEKQHKNSSDMSSSFENQNSRTLIVDAPTIKEFSNTLTVQQDIIADSRSVSPRFDEDIDRGFEEALNASYASRESVYSGSGTNFESLSESADQIDVFDDQNSISEENFVTQAVVSSTVFDIASSISFDDPLANSSFIKKKNVPKLINNSPLSDETNSSNSELADSGFNSGMDVPVRKPLRMSPWPETHENIKSSEFTFETDFTSSARQTPDGSQENNDALSADESSIKCDIKPVYF